MQLKGEIGNSREEKKQARHEKEKQSGKSRPGVARTSRLSLERRRGARALHGRDRWFSRSEARSIRRRLAAYGMAVDGAREDRAAGHSGIQPQPQARLTWIS